MNSSLKLLSELIIYGKYGKYLPSEQRRENWDEICNRVEGMHIKKFPSLEEEIKEIFKAVKEKKILPSMRSAQFASKPIELSPTRSFNCAYAPIDDVRVFSEIMFLLLNGCGVGISVQKHHVRKLPPILGPKRRSRRHLIGDSIAGWADAIKVLVESYFYNKSRPVFDYRDIRAKGTPLKTSGGKAPGPQPLKDCIHNLTKIFDNAIESRGIGTKLETLEVHDMICYIADAVLAGGLRRSALISFFSIDDEDMLTCKFGKWYELNPQRARSNNSAVILRHKIREKKFFQLWKRISDSGTGEPGVYFSNDQESMANPCVTKDTWVNTKDGNRRVANLINTPFTAIVDGEERECKEGFWYTGNKPVFKLVTEKGYSLKLTENHKLLRSNGEWCELRNLNVGEDIVLSNHSNSKYNKSKVFNDGYKYGSSDDLGIPENIESVPVDFKFGFFKSAFNNITKVSSDLDTLERVQRLLISIGKVSTISYRNLILELVDSSYTDKISSIKLIGDEDVFDCTVEGHRFCANGIIAHNCNEASLNPLSFCNLTTINVNDVDTQEELNYRAKLASRLGTIQASYTDFHYLRDEWQETTERDSLLGVSMTGIANENVLKLNFSEAASIVLGENERVAKDIGINTAKRTTLVKPEGTTSLVLGTSSGVGPWYAKYYIRRIRINKEENLYKYLKRAIPNLVEDDVLTPETDAVISIPIAAPDGAITKDEGSISQLERIKKLHEEWIRPGHIEGSNTHNVSCTVNVSNWDEVGRWMWNNRDYYNGIAVLPDSDIDYEQLPHEEIDRDKYEEMCKYVKNIDLTKVNEVEDNTKIRQSVACGGGSCELKSI